MTPFDTETVRLAYNAAVKLNEETFTVTLSDGREVQFVTKFAGYLLEYIDGEK